MLLAAKFIVEAGEDGHSGDAVTLIRLPPFGLELERPEAVMAKCLERIMLVSGADWPVWGLQVTLEGLTGLIGDQQDHRSVDPRGEGVALGKFRSRMAGLHCLLGSFEVVPDDDEELLAPRITEISLPLGDPCGHLAAHQLSLIFGQLAVTLGLSFDWTLVLPTVLFAEFGHGDVKRTGVGHSALEKGFRLLPRFFLFFSEPGGMRLFGFVDVDDGCHDMSPYDEMA